MLGKRVARGQAGDERLARRGDGGDEPALLL
jgi:hypothetical protein